MEKNELTQMQSIHGDTGFESFALILKMKRVEMGRRKTHGP